MLDAADLERAVEEARLSPENIPLPDYTFDCHTIRGKKKGKTKDDFFRDEFAALDPREQGEFDWTVTGERRTP
jgi:hypothetical protein